MSPYHFRPQTIPELVYCQYGTHQSVKSKNDLIIWQLYLLEVFIKEEKREVKCLGVFINENLYMNEALVENMR